MSWFSHSSRVSRVMVSSALFACTAWAVCACPTHAPDATAQAQLIEQVRAAPSAGDARAINAQLWEIWTAAPDARAQELLDTGMERLRLGDYESAEKAFDALVAYCPDYAEGYNQRAFANYLRNRFDLALVDLEAALGINPVHIGALSGKALTLMGLERDKEALDALNGALDLNPWLNERALVPVLKERLGERDL